MGKSNQVADALSQQPENPESSSESLDEDGEWETISYEMVCQILNHHLDSVKLPYSVKYEAQTNITNVEVANQNSGLGQVNVIDVCNSHTIYRHPTGCLIIQKVPNRLPPHLF